MDTLLEGAKTILALPRHLHRAGDAIESLEHRARVLRLLEHEPIALLALAERFLDALALADIAVDTLEAHGGAVQGAHGPRSTLELDDATVLAQSGDLEGRRQLLADQRSAGALGHSLPVDRGNQRLPVLPHELVRRPARELRVGAIHARDVALQAARHDRVAGVVDEVAITFLALPDGLLREPALTDVPVDTLVPDRFARRVPEQPCPALEGHHTPIPPDRRVSEHLRQPFPCQQPAHALIA